MSQIIVVNVQAGKSMLDKGFLVKYTLRVWENPKYLKKIDIFTSLKPFNVLVHIALHIANSGHGLTKYVPVM